MILIVETNIKVINNSFIKVGLPILLSKPEYEQVEIRGNKISLLSISFKNSSKDGVYIKNIVLDDSTSQQLKVDAYLNPGQTISKSYSYSCNSTTTNLRTWIYYSKVTSTSEVPEEHLKEKDLNCLKWNIINFE